MLDPIPSPVEALVEERRGPLDEAGVDRRGEGEDALGDVAVVGDRDDGDDPRLQQQDLDAVDRRGADRGRRRERQQVVGLGERRRRLPEGVLDLAARLRQPAHRDRRALRRARRRLDQAVGEAAVAGVGRDPAGGGVGLASR